MSCHVMSCHVMSYRIVSYRIISYHIIYRIVSYLIAYHIISYHIISYIVSYRVVSYHITSYHTIKLTICLKMTYLQSGLPNDLFPPAFLKKECCPTISSLIISSFSDGTKSASLNMVIRKYILKIHNSFNKINQILYTPFCCCSHIYAHSSKKFPYFFNCITIHISNFLHGCYTPHLLYFP